MSSEQQKVAQVCELTCVPPAKARRLLQLSDWEVSTACALFFDMPEVVEEQGGDDAAADFHPAPEAEPVPVPVVEQPPQQQQQQQRAEEGGGDASVKYDRGEDARHAAGASGGSIEVMAAKLGLDPSGAELAVLCWRGGVETSKDVAVRHFVRAAEHYRARTVGQLRDALVRDTRALLDAAGREQLRALKAFYAWLYDMSKSEAGARMDMDTAAVLWQMVLPPERFPQMAALPAFAQKEIEEHQRSLDRKMADLPESVRTTLTRPPLTLSRDSWVLMLDLALALRSAGEAGYSEDDSWPLLVDRYMEFRRASQPQ